MQTVPVLRKGKHRIIRLPHVLDFKGVNELKLICEGETPLLRPVRTDRSQFSQPSQTEADCMTEIEAIVISAGHIG